jgi:hypothetical protein
METNATLTVLKNGISLGVVFDNLPEGPFYPAVSLYYDEATVSFLNRF